MSSDTLIAGSGNILLARLPAEEARRCEPHFRRINLERQMSLAETGARMETVHFPEAGVISCVASDDGSRTEVGLIGREGMTGLPIVMGDDTAPFDLFVQVDSSTALEIDTADLVSAIDDCPQLRASLLRYVYTFMLQTSYAIVSCSQHLMEARLARWLLMCHDRVTNDQIELTHEFMGMMISAQRSGVTITLHSLEGAGMIRSTRGLVTITDRDKLEELAGDSYGKPESRYRDLIAPFGK